MRVRRSKVLWAGAMLAGTGLHPATAIAQQAQATLEELSVTSPSPIVSNRASTPFSGPPVGVLPVVTNTFSPVTVVTAEQIARDQPRTLGDALSTAPASRPPPTRRARPAGRSSGASTTTGCASRRTGRDPGRLGTRRGSRGPDQPSGRQPDRGDPGSGLPALRLPGDRRGGQRREQPRADLHPGERHLRLRHHRVLLRG